MMSSTIYHGEHNNSNYTVVSSCRLTRKYDKRGLECADQRIRPPPRLGVTIPSIVAQMSILAASKMNQRVVSLWLSFVYLGCII